MLAKKVQQSVSWMLAGRVVTNVIAVGSTLVVAKLLMPSDLEYFCSSDGIVHIVLATFRLRNDLLYQMNDPQKEDFDTVFTLNMARGLALGGAVLLVAWPFSLVYHEPRLFPLVAMLSLYPVLLSLPDPYFELFAKDISFLLHRHCWMSGQKLRVLWERLGLLWFSRATGL
ncbi:MAG: oligosaccharide flippase family protein [Hyphomonas sp.]